ncbi:MAG: energy transducer TonB [Candidatus Eisenbacteria bacterium]
MRAGAERPIPSGASIAPDRVSRTVRVAAGRATAVRALIPGFLWVVFTAGFAASAFASAAPGPDSTTASGAMRASTHTQTAVAESAGTATPPPGAHQAGVTIQPTRPAASANDTTIGTGARIPGTVLRMGDGAGRVRRRYAVSAGDAAGTVPGELALEGEVRYFGIPSRARLVFDPTGLSRASFSVTVPSPNQRDYLEDQMVRSGYRRQCQRLDDQGRECDWTGALIVHVKCDSAMMTAEVVAVGAELTRSLHLPTAEERQRAVEEARLRPILSDPTPILSDTLSIDPAAPPGRLAPPVLLQAIPAPYDDALSARGIKGIVQVLALVGIDGLVQYSRATDGPKELQATAMRTVTHFRFSGYLFNGQKMRFWVWIPVRFGV